MLALSAVLTACEQVTSVDGGPDGGAVADGGRDQSETGPRDAASADASAGDAAVSDLGRADARAEDAADGSTILDAQTADDAGAADAASDAGISDAGDPPILPSNLISAASSEICSALFRCCSAGDIEAYFAPLLAHNRLAAFAGRLPPAATLSATACPSLLGEMFEITPFGPWVEAAELGTVGFDAAAAAACLDELSSASCGAEASAALFDSTCFGFAAPPGGSIQRRIFVRTRTAGESCVPLNDGFGGAIFGTCDPEAAFCCVPSAQDPSRCVIGTAAGTCRAASQVGEVCAFAPLQVCATGLECNADVCETPNLTPLATGDLCYDTASFTLLGECTDGYCDLFGTSRCESPRALGVACSQGYECLSGFCSASSCAEPPPYCAGP